MTGDEIDGNTNARVTHPTLEIQAAQAQHSHGENQTGGRGFTWRA
jgi:hypothetical protein